MAQSLAYKRNVFWAVLRLLDCDLCNANNGSVVNCTFSSSPRPTEVKFDNQLVPVKEAVGFENYVISVSIHGKPRQYALMISNGCSSPILVECESSFCKTAGTIVLIIGNQSVPTLSTTAVPTTTIAPTSR